MRSPLPFSSLNNVVSLSGSLHNMASKPLTGLVALLWAHSRPSMPFSYCAAYNQTQYSSCDLTRAQYRGTIMSQLLLDTLVLIQAMMPLVTLVHFQSAVHQPPQIVFYQAAFQPLFPKPVVLLGVVTKLQDPTLGFVKHHSAELSPLI